MEKKFLLIVGLGNPGDKYAHTRHNAGWEVMELLEKKLGVKTRKKMLQPWAEAEWTDGPRKIILCRPLTLLIIYDDIDLAPGAVRVRPGGGPGTHNGMRSIVNETGTDAFPRIRVGTGDRPKGEDLVAWVLGRPSAEEKPLMEAAYRKAAECAEEWAASGIDAAMRFCAQRSC